MIITMENLKDVLARNIDRFIEESDYSVKELADKMKISDVSIHRWKSGANPPDVKNLEELSRILKIDPSEFYKSTNSSVVNISPGKALRKFLVIPDRFVELAQDISDNEEAWEVLIKQLEHDVNKIRKKARDAIR